MKILIPASLCLFLTLNPHLTLVADDIENGAQNPIGQTSSLKFYGNLSKAELKSRMKYISKSLGVKCSYCHLKDKRTSLTDEIRNPRERKILERKRVALEMIRMVEHINSNYLNWKHGSGRKADQVDCQLCHRGKPEHLVND